MALLTTPTNDQLTDLRSDANYRAVPFVCFEPNTTVVQFQPSAAPGSDVFAEIAVGSIGTGSMSDVRTEMRVIFSTTTDPVASEVYRTRVRAVSGTGTLYIAECSQTLTTSHYVTVQDAYDVVEKLRKSEEYADWNVPVRKLLPIETTQPSAVLLTNDETEYTFVSTPKAMDASATTSFTHSWESSNSNDTLDSGGTTATPTWTFEAGAFRNVRHTFTDSNGNSNFHVTRVWTIPKDYSASIHTGIMDTSGETASITYDTMLGWTATLPAWTGISTLLNGTYCAIGCDEWINNTRQSIRSNVQMVGYLASESTNTRGDAEYGQVSETRFTVEGIGHQLGRQNVASIPVTRITGTPAAWGEITNLTPGRVLTYRLTEDSNVLNTCALSIPADDTDFIGDDLTLPGSKAMDDAGFIGSGINAELQFDVNGRMDFCRDLNILNDTARNAAATIITFTAADLLNLTYDYDYNRTCSQATITGGSFDTTTGEYNIFEGIAPAVARERTGDPLAIPDQVLTTDNTAAESQTEISQRAANLFAQNNPAYMARFTPKGEFHWLMPDVGSWIVFDVPSSSTVRGKTFTSADRWQIVEKSVSFNAETGAVQADFSARHETQDTGAMVRAAPVIVTNEVTQVFAPATTLPFSGLPTLDGLFYDSLDTQPPGNQNPPDDPACELGGFRVKSVLGYETTFSADNGEQVSVTVRGAGKIASLATYADEMTSALGPKTYQLSATYPLGTYSGAGATLNGTNGGTWSGSDGRSGGGCIHGANVYTIVYQATAVVDLGAEYTVATVNFWYNHLTPVTTASGQSITFWDENKISLLRVPFDIGNHTTYHEVSWTGTQAGVRYITCEATSGGGQTAVDDITIGYGGAGGDTYGDALYQWTGTLDNPDSEPTPYDPGEGLLIETAQPSSIPPYTPTHEYTMYEIVTSGPVLLQYESPYSLSEASNWSIQAIVCRYGVP